MKYQFHNSIMVALFLVFAAMLTASADQTDNSDSDDPAELKKAFNLARNAWLSADIETYFTFIHPSSKYVSYSGYTGAIKVKNKEDVRQDAQNQHQRWSEQIDNMTFICQDKTAIVTYNLIRTNKSNGSEVRLKTSEVWIRVDENWLRLHHHSSDLTWRFENAIRAFERTDDKTAPPLNAVVVIGSSSIRGWRKMIHEDLAPITIIPRGFGGSTMNDAFHCVNRIVIPYQPRAIVVYEGDNDLARGYSSKQIKATFVNFIDRVHRQLPESRIYFLSIKPSPKRWKLWPQIQETNGLIAEICQKHPQLTYVDIATPMLDVGGVVRKDIFTNDNLHLNREGYVIWRNVLKPILIDRELAFESKADSLSMK